MRSVAMPLPSVGARLEHSRFVLPRLVGAVLRQAEQLAGSDRRPGQVVALAQLPDALARVAAVATRAAIDQSVSPACTR